MQHRNSIRILGRKRNQRIALLRSLAISLIEHGKIVTTEAKAKELRPFIEKLVTRGREDGISARRFISSRLGGESKQAGRLVDEIAVRYKERNGGYTRITKLATRLGDTSKMAAIEFV